MIHRPYIFLDHPTGVTRLASKSPLGVGLRQNRQRLDSHRAFCRDSKAKEINKKPIKVNKTSLAIGKTYEKENANPEITSKVTFRKFAKISQTNSKQSARAISNTKGNKIVNNLNTNDKLHIETNNWIRPDENKGNGTKENNENVVPVNKLLEMLKCIESDKNPINIVPQSTKGHSKPILKEDPIQENKLMHTECNNCIAKAIKEVNAEINSKPAKHNIEPHESRNSYNCLSGVFAESLNHLLVGKQIGQGAYASVRIAFDRKLGHKVALKIYDKGKLLEPQRQRNVQNEIMIMRKLNHSSIVKLYAAFDTRRHVVLEMENVKGMSLHGFLKSKEKRRLDEPEAKRIFTQILKGIEHCHSNDVAHRDIKLENLLMDETQNIKIIDFGFSTCMSAFKKIRIFCGTPSYMSPEIVTRKEYSGPPADIWALGVLLYAMLCGTFPFRGATDKELYHRISHGLFTFPSHLSPSSKSLISRMLIINPDERPTVKDVLDDPWLIPSIGNIQFFQAPSSTKNRPTNTNSFFINNCKKKELALDFSKPKIPRNIHPETAVNKNDHDNIAQMNYHFVPRGEDDDILKGETLDLEVVTTIAKLGYSVEEVEREVRNKNSYIRSIYDRYKMKKRDQKFTPEDSYEKAKTPKGSGRGNGIGFIDTTNSTNNHSSRGKIAFR